MNNKIKITFLGQGYEPESRNSIGNHLLRLLSKKVFHTFTGISGFASEAGILGLSDHIINAKKHFNSLNLIIGVDQGKTSKEALYQINDLRINSYIFHQSETPIFHPKIYLFEGIKETKIIIGSSNMTARGLFGNIESSLLLEFSPTNESGKQLLMEIKNYFAGLFNFTDPNLFKISDESIQDFIDIGIVPNETIVPKKYGKKTANEVNSSGKLELMIPKRDSPAVPDGFRSKSISPKGVDKIINELEILDDLNDSK